MTTGTEREAEVAVAELRSFVSLYDDADLACDSRIARQLDAVRRLSRPRRWRHYLAARPGISRATRSRA